MFRIALYSLCFLAGVIMLGATCFAAIASGPGWGSPTSYIYVAGALIVATASLSIGLLRHEGRGWLGLCVFLGLLAVEAFWLQSAAERYLEAYSRQRAPIIAQAAKISAAEQRLTEARKEQAARAVEMPRLTAALATQRDALKAAAADAAKRTCASNCRKLHEEAIAQARNEVALARAEHADRLHRADETLAEAKAALAALPRLTTVSLASYFGLSPQAYGLVGASLMSGMNILGMLMLIAAGHAPTQSGGSNSVATYNQIARFTIDQYAPSVSGHVALSDAFKHYISWCNMRRERKIDPETFLREFGAVIKASQLPVERYGDRILIKGMAPIQQIEAEPVEAA